MTSGQVGKRHVAKPAGSWPVDMWPSVTRLVSVRRRNVLPARHLTALTGTRGFGHPVTFCDAFQKQKQFNDESSFVAGKKQFCDVYEPYVMMAQIWRGFHDIPNFVINLSRNFLYDGFGIYNDEYHSSPMHRFSLVATCVMHRRCGTKPSAMSDQNQGGLGEEGILSGFDSSMV